MDKQGLGPTRARIISLLRREPADLSIVEKARLVWDATWLGNREPLDDKTAEALGKDLDWAARFRKTAGSSLSPDARDLIQQIECAAHKLEGLLAYSTVAHKTAAFKLTEQYLEFPSTLDDVRFVLLGLCEATEKTKARRRHDNLHLTFKVAGNGVYSFGQKSL
jgi:hypothetical protein